MTGPFLLALFDEADSLFFHRFLDFLGLMANHDENSFWQRQLACGPHHMFHQRLAARAMQNFGFFRFHPGAESRGENHDGDGHLYDSTMPARSSAAGPPAPA